MPLPADLARAAASVLLTPAPLRQSPTEPEWRRALVAGAGAEETVAAAVAELRRAAPEVSVDLFGAAGGGGLWSLRRRRYDVACLLLTGEGRRGEKVRALLCGAPAMLARGASGQWYRVRLPAVRPLSLRWWARLCLAGLLSAVCALVALVLRGADALWVLSPAPPAPRPPGALEGRRVTFIMPTYNQRHLVDFCLPALLAEAGHRHRVLVVDDAGTDGTSEYIRQKYPAAQVLRLPENRGFAGAVRAGIAASDTPLFALINSDVQVRRPFLTPMLRWFAREDVFAVSSRIDLPDGDLTETGKVVASFSGLVEPHHLAPDRAGAILYAQGACSLFHRAQYEALGGLDTLYRPLYWEDLDLGYRAWRRGWRSVFEPAASVLHKRRAWMGSAHRRAYTDEIFLRNALLFVWKNVRDPRMLVQHVAYVAIRLLREVTAGEALMAHALLRAVPAAPAALSRRWRERRRGDLPDRDILRLSTPQEEGEGA